MRQSVIKAGSALHGEAALDHRRYFGAWHACLALAMIAQMWPRTAAAQDMEQDGPGTDDQVQASDDAALTVYPAEFFAGQNPVTALDMVERLPGFTIDGGANIRGITGNEPNVLIDSVYPLSRGGSISAVLERIPATDVERIEVLRGSAPGINFYGWQMVANVIRRSSGSTWLVAEEEVEYIDHRLGATFSVDAGMRRNGDTAQLSASYFDYDGRHSRSGQQTFLPSGALQQTEAMRTRYVSRGANASGGAEIYIGQARLNANTSYSGSNDRSDIRGDVDVVDGSDFVWAYLTDSKTDFTDISIEVESPLGAATTLTVTAMHSLSISRTDDDYADAYYVSRSSSRFRIEQTNARLLLTQKIGDAVTLDISGEGSFNRAEQDYSLTSNGFEVPIPLARADISEDRGLFLAKATWRGGGKLTIVAGGALDISRISVNFDDLDQAQSFTFFKPQFTATYTPDKVTTIRASVKREVAQLSLTGFAASAALDTELVNAGDASLVPERSWQFEASAERRFGKEGSVELTLLHERIDNAIDNLVLPGGFNAQGNVGKARLTELTANVSLPLGMVGLDNAILKGEAIGSWSRITDPITGEKRRISGQSPVAATISFTQDFAETGISWGLEYSVSAPSKEYRVAELVRSRDSQTLQAHIRYKMDGEITLRLFTNIGLRGSRTMRDYYVDDRASAVLRRREVGWTDAANAVGISLRKAW